MGIRSIEFRGKRVDNGEWIYGDLLQIPEHDVYSIMEQKGNAGHYLIDKNTIGQYTGLKDANGTKIFEGDIFKFNDEVFDSYETDCGTEYDSCEVENYAVVGFCKNTGKFDFIKYKFYNNQVEADLHENHDIEFYDFISELEVIGNIYDNPELLKGASK